MDAGAGLQPSADGTLDRILARFALTEHIRALRIAFFLCGDAALLAFSIVGAFWLRFDGMIPPLQRAFLLPAVAVSLLVKLPIFAFGRLYVMRWSQVGLDEMVSVFVAGTLGTVVFWLVVLVLRDAAVLSGFPRSVLLIDYIVTLYGVSCLRMGRRAFDYMTRRAPSNSRRALIVGAGTAGVQLARSLRNTREPRYRPVGFVDDDPRTIGTVIQGIPVLGSRDRLTAVVTNRHIDAVLIAMPTAGSKIIRNVVSMCREADVRDVRTIPGLDHFLNREVSFSDLRDVRLEDLLGRETVSIDREAVGEWLRDQTVLITGASGSIGSELCLQVAQFRPARLVAVDCDETGVFRIEHELRRAGQPSTIVLGDIRDDRRMAETVVRFAPDIVFHAAAYKHVGLMERHPRDAVLTNVLGTLSVARASAAAGVAKFILVSTDKAVNPSSVMGASKRVAEHVCHALNGQGKTRYAAVRFGNVLGSRGSVIPLFVDKLRRGEPITVRGVDMQRYFMAVSEAVALVLQAGLMAAGGETFVLDMGEPVKIVDLARDLVRFSGLEPGTDVPITFAEPEPGEKDHEDLLTAEEGTIVTRHDRVRVARGGLPFSAEQTLERIARLGDAARTGRLAGTLAILQELVPTYRPSQLMLQQVVGELREVQAASAAPVR